MIAVLVWVFCFAALPLVFQITGFSVEGPVLSLLKLCGFALGIAYVVFGPHQWPFKSGTP